MDVWFALSKAGVTTMRTTQTMQAGGSAGWVSAGGDDALVQQVAARWGDVAVVTRVAPEMDELVTVAVRHREPSRQAQAEGVLGTRFKRGSGLASKVWESEQGILIVDADRGALSSIGPSTTRAYVREVGLRSLMLVPLREQGRVVGTLGVSRDEGGAPYTEADFEAFSALAQR